jgi:hypothetical protein
MKDLDSDVGPDSNSELNRRKWIIDVKPSVTITTTNVFLEEPKEPKEGNHLFHSKKWEKGPPPHFIVYNGSQNNLISTEVVKRLGTRHILQPVTSHALWH